MYDTSKLPRSSNTNGSHHREEPTTPRPRLNPHLVVPSLSPGPRHRASPALDEFSLRLTPSRGGTASPAPAKGTRKRLHQYRNFDHAVELIKTSGNIVVLTGAGISTSVGIPDFRSDKGLYSQLSKDLGITEAEEFFSKDYFVQNTAQFFQYVRRVIPEAVMCSDGFFRPTNSKISVNDGKAPVPKFSPTHAFLALLHSKRKLLTNYTQNIDGLETAAGVPRAKFVQCHGSWDTASCMTCGRSAAAKKYLPVVFAGNIPYCKCKLEAEQKSKRRKKGKKRKWDDFDSDHSSDDGTQAPRGLMKPDITFFNERLSGLFGDRLNEDRRNIDLLIIIGTSLKVGPVQDMLYQIAPKVPQIFISKERFSGALCNLPGVQVDIELLGECDVIIEEMCRRAGWSKELQSLCWSKGQMKITGSITKSSHSQLKSNKDSNKLSTDQPHEAKREITSQIKSNKDGGTLGDPDPAASLNDSNGAMSTTTNFTIKTENKSGHSHDSSHRQESGLKHQILVEQTVIEAKTAASTTTFADKHKLNITTNNAIATTDSFVKIELVEGTTHQWRVTKK